MEQTFRYKINLLGTEDIKEFVRICMQAEGSVELFCPKTGYRVNGKSLLAAVCTIEWNELWVETTNEHLYSKIEKWIVLGDDTATVHD